MAAAGDDALCMDEEAVVAVIAGLSGRDFGKSMPPDVNPAVWQDVYRPVAGSRELYVKFTRSKDTDYTEPGRGIERLGALSVLRGIGFGASPGLLPARVIRVKFLSSSRSA